MLPLLWIVAFVITMYVTFQFPRGEKRWYTRFIKLSSLEHLPFIAGVFVFLLILSCEFLEFIPVSNFLTGIELSMALSTVVGIGTLTIVSMRSVRTMQLSSAQDRRELRS